MVERLATALRVDRLRVFGGAALDLLADPQAACHDIDVALPWSYRKRFKPSPEIAVASKARPYWIRFDVPVVIITGQWRDTVVDINFLDDVDKIGHFDIEQVWWDYPDRTFSDPHNVAHGPVGTFCLVTALDADNPLLLLNRIIKLSAKYDVAFWRQEHLRHLVTQLATSVTSWTPRTHFHGPVAHHAHLRAVASSVRRALHPEAFLAGCVDAGVFNIRLELLAHALRREPSAVAWLASAGTDEAFWAAADTLVARGDAGWRRYREEKPCGSAS